MAAQFAGGPARRKASPLERVVVACGCVLSTAGVLWLGLNAVVLFLASIPTNLAAAAGVIVGIGFARRRPWARAASYWMAAGVLVYEVAWAALLKSRVGLLDYMFQPAVPWYAAVAFAVILVSLALMLSSSLRARKSKMSLTSHVCPVCGYSHLSEPAWVGNGASYQGCPSCGTEFGYDDDAARDDTETREDAWRRLRKEWVAAGSPWRSSIVDRPADWDPEEQLRAADDPRS